MYLQHVLVHTVPALWRVHRMHHAVIPKETNSNSGNYLITHTGAGDGRS